MNGLICSLFMLIVVAGGLTCEPARAAQQTGEDRTGQAQSPATPAPRIICTEQDKDAAAALKPHLQQDSNLKPAD